MNPCIIPDDTLTESYEVRVPLDLHGSTSLAVAQALASANPHLTPALIVVRSLTARGRGGWGTTIASRRYIAVDGIAAAVSHRPVRSSASELLHCYYNGSCTACGRVFAQYCLTWSVCEDPYAGQPIPGRKVPTVFAKAFALLCPDCLRANPQAQEYPSLVDPTSWAYDLRQEDDGAYTWLLRRMDPVLARYPDLVGVYHLEIDLTGPDPVVEGAAMTAQTINAQTTPPPPEAPEDKIVRIDLWQQPQGVFVEKYTRGQRQSYNQRLDKEQSLDDMVAWLQAHGWTVRRWSTGARAWLGKPTPVRSRYTIQYLRTLYTQRPSQLPPGVQLCAIDLALDL